MKKFSLKKTAFCAMLGTISIYAFQKMYRSSKEKSKFVISQENMRFSHQYPEDARVGLPVLEEKHFVEEEDMPRRKVLNS